MLKRFKILAYIIPILVLGSLGCKKGTFDINANNPNQPSQTNPDYVLSAAMTSTATVAQGGDEDFLDYYMGYWATSGDYQPNPTLETYNLNTDFGADNWNSTYLTLANYNYVLTHAPSSNYAAIALIMEAYSYERLIDLYNNIPYTSALQAGTNNYPSFDNAKAIYPKLVSQLDSAISIISPGAKAPGTADIVFQGNMNKWIRFANTLKLRILINLTETDAAFIQAHVSGLSSSSFLQAGEDAAVNPGYSSAADNQQSPIYQDLGFFISGAPHTDNVYVRATTYAVNFYSSTNDPRLGRYYALTTQDNTYRGRAFGSTALEHNATISGVGPGVISSPSQSAILMPATESFFLQAEAYQRNLIAGDAKGAYQQAVTESMRLLGVPDPAGSAATYTAQSNPKVNWGLAPDKIALIITQAWAAYNVFDPLESYNNWRRLGIPADLPISIFPGTTSTHIPYRLDYPTSEFKYNSANVDAQGTLDPFTSKVYFMP